VKLQQEKFEVEKLKSNLAETKESVEDKRDNLQKLNEQLQQVIQFSKAIRRSTENCNLETR
jgi:septal ring factor EnvC (AmiA/AmiB activator)